MEFIDSVLLNFVAAESLPTAQMVLWIVLAVIAVLFVLYLIRRLTRPRFAGGSRSKKARLAITDAARVDEHGRSVVLLRRDDVEHLLLIGGPNDLVIESNIRKLDPANAQQTNTNVAAAATAAAAIAAPVAAAAAAEPAAQPAPQPAPASATPPSASPTFESDMQDILDKRPAPKAAPSAPPAVASAPTPPPAPTPKETILPPPSSASSSVSAVEKPRLDAVTAPTLAKPDMTASSPTIDPPKPASPPLAQPVSSSAQLARREPPSFSNSTSGNAPAAPKPPTAAEEMEALLNEVELPKRPG